MLDAYLDLAPEQRESFLSESRRRYPRLSRWFERLARESRTSTSLLSQTPGPIVDEALEQLSAQAAPDLEPGTRLGPWRIIEWVGAGGMGKVYLGERADGAFEMRVAIKLIGSRRPGLAEQLNWECRLLARLDHSAVTRLVDAGVTEDGEPFLVMEWVEGIDLDRWLKSERPDLERRLQVFQEVAGAVSHAHQRLIIHGDIKPGNIRIRHDGQVKLMDFGVAALMTDTDRGSPVVAAMTPAFAAPEQLDREPVTTRSDVWSLGALLFWILQGRQPARNDRQHSVDGLKAYPRGRELTAIIDKACTRDPDQRYDSVQSLAGDIDHYLHDRPLVAAPPGGLLRMFKLARRNKLAFGSVVAVTVALVAGVSISTVLYLQAESERERAERHAGELEQVARFQEEQLEDIDTAMMGVHLRDGIYEQRRSVLAGDGLGQEEIERSLTELEHMLAGVDFTNLALEWLDQNVLQGTIEGIEEQFADQPLVRARLLQSVANTMRNLALYERANPLQDKALEIRTRLLGADAPATMRSIREKGLLLRNQGKLSEAEDYALQALEARQRVLGDDHPDTLESVSDLGVLLGRQGKLAEAEPYYRRALDGRRRVLGDDHADTLTSMSNIGVLLVSKGRLDEAEPFMRQALEGRRRVLGENQRATLMSINNMGVLLRHQEEYVEAESYYREALERSRQVRGEDHPSTLDILNNIGVLLDQQGRYAEARQYYRQAMEGKKRLLGQDNPATLVSIYNLGRVLREEGSLAEAEQLGREALERSRELLAPGHWHTAVFAAGYAKTLAALGRFPEAEALMLEAYGIFMEVLGEGHSRTIELMEDFAGIYAAWHAAAPGQGHDQSQAQWRARVNAVKQEVVAE